MPLRTSILSRGELPEAAFDLFRSAFPDDKYDQRAFWPPDSVHAVVYRDDQLVAHAGFLVRPIRVDGRAIETAYLEYVSAEPRRQGFGTLAMRALHDEIARRAFAFAALATGTPEFYESLGWLRWRGDRGYRMPDGKAVPTPDEIVMVLDLGAQVDVTAPIEADWRAGGDPW